jgi:hypothetical protein
MLRGHLQFTIGEFWWTAHPWMAVVDQCRGKPRRDDAHHPHRHTPPSFLKGNRAQI